MRELLEQHVSREPKTRVPNQSLEVLLSWLANHSRTAIRNRFAMPPPPPRTHAHRQSHTAKCVSACDSFGCFTSRRGTSGHSGCASRSRCSRQRGNPCHHAWWPPRKGKGKEAGTFFYCTTSSNKPVRYNPAMLTYQTPRDKKENARAGSLRIQCTGPSTSPYANDTPKQPSSL